LPKVLFILKHREHYGASGYWNEEEYGDAVLSYSSTLSSGLLNSARFIVEMLNDNGVEARLVEVLDNNYIDREVAAFRPDIVFIEALWVVPDKFDVLQKLHPRVKWVVRGHSAVPFLAQEGVAIEWITGYVRRKNVVFAPNSRNLANDVRAIVGSANPSWSDSEVEAKIPFLPNYYPFQPVTPASKAPDDVLDVGCFGAIRPFKNQLTQAVAAIKYAKAIGKSLRFHINGMRVETGGASVLKNLRALFQATGQQLVEHGWMGHPAFLSMLQTCDVGMQVSYSETFNIVSADMTVAGLPMVVSPAVGWASQWSKADPNSADDIAFVLALALEPSSRSTLLARNASGLRCFCSSSQAAWLAFVKSQSDPQPAPAPASPSPSKPVPQSSLVQASVSTPIKPLVLTPFKSDPQPAPAPASVPYTPYTPLKPQSSLFRSLVGALWTYVRSFLSKPQTTGRCSGGSWRSIPPLSPK